MSIGTTVPLDRFSNSPAILYNRKRYFLKSATVQKGLNMAETIPFPQGNRKKNLKADIFDNYTKAKGLNFFKRRDVHDSYDTSVFMTAIPAGKHHKLVAAVITDNSMYILLRVHLGTAPKGPARKTFMAFLNHLNAHHAIMKYVVGSDDNVFLDVTTTTRAEKFDPEVVRITLDMIIYHLGEVYDDIARRLDKPGDETNGFSL